MSNPLHVVILAAGQGKRMRSTSPKVLAHVGGKRMIDHVLDTARQLKPEHIHVVVGHGADQVKDALKDQADINYCLQRQQKGTGDAVSCALPDIPEQARVLVLYGDAPLIEVAQLNELLQTDENNLAVLTAELKDPETYGRIVRGADGHVARIVEHADADELQRSIREINTGILVGPAQLLRDTLAQIDALNAQGELYLTDVVELTNGMGKTVEGMCLVGDMATRVVQGANDRIQLAHLERAYQLGKAEELMIAGVQMLDPERTEIRGTVEAGQDVIIDVNTILEGKVVLKDGVIIGAGAIVINCELGPNTRVQPYSVLEGVVTEGNCDIGPFARLRPGTELAEETRIGNFVETKKAKLGKGSKASHLSYLGDTTIGKHVNIGAGTITCNYDGHHKYQTTIEDGAFIGSDTQLVAPVKVGKNAVVGAGSTITKDAPGDALTISRARQKSMPGWKPRNQKS